MSKTYSITVCNKQAAMLKKVSEQKGMSEEELIEYYLSLAIPQKGNKRTIIQQVNSGLFDDFNVVAKINETSVSSLLKTLMLEECDREFGKGN